MFRRACLTAAVALPLAASAALAASGGWPQVWDRLDSWDGASKVVVASDYGNPYAVPAFQKLVNGLLDRGFTVLQSEDPDGLPDDAGLHAELRKTGSGPVLAITRRSNGAIVALAPVKGKPQPGAGQGASASGGQQTSAKGTQATTGTGQATTTRSGGTQSTRQAAMRPRRLDVQGHPRRLAITSAPGETLSLALLYRNRLEVADLEQGQLVKRTSHRPGTGTGRALHVGAGDVNDDGATEIAATWGHDFSPEKGTVTRVHSRIFQERGLNPVGGDYRGFLRVVDSGLYGQRRTETETFAGSVERLRLSGGEVSREASDGAFAGADIFDATPVDDSTVALWTGPGRMQLGRRGSGSAVSASAAVGLGEMAHPWLLTMRDEPKVITGPEADYGTEYDKRVVLPRRVRVAENGDIYTIERKRSPGLMGLTGSRGKDRVVRLAAKQRGLRQAGGFPPLDWFVLDFDLVELERGGPAAVVLANQARDGSGDAAIFLMGFPES
ncbi:hypothetical protein SAMN05216241_10854 [Limimonas halophila]|uniref:Repeat domain-containing protein n=1 Tax=Limimonas halophila TaxID=1082479 RepID=A0A1G7T2Q2_9PROT|nr:hypothetical protein [Limimonas halophila]SDG29372.1 hypothetical protein SAMN05216241_10854 [Limimonas halophila]